MQSYLASFSRVSLVAMLFMVLSLGFFTEVLAQVKTQPKPAAQVGGQTSVQADTQETSRFVICGNTVDNPCNVTHLFKVVVIIINYLISTAGLVAILFIVIAGVQMVVSRGEGMLKESKDRLNGAVIGLVLVALAYVLVNSIFTGSLNIGVRCGNWVLTDPAAYINNTNKDSGRVCGQ